MNNITPSTYTLMDLWQSYILLSDVIPGCYPSGVHGVNTTSHQRRCNDMTLHQRWYDVDWALRSHWWCGWFFLFTITAVRRIRSLPAGHWFCRIALRSDFFFFFFFFGSGHRAILYLYSILQKISYPEQGSNPGPLVLEASSLTTALPCSFQDGPI